MQSIRPRGDRGWPIVFGERPELLAAFRRGERAALVIVYGAYVERIERLIRGGWRSPSGEHAEPPAPDAVADLVQETFVRAFAARARLAFDGVRDLGPYLGSIARNLLVDLARRRRREVATQGTDDAVAAPAPEDADAPWADAATLRRVEAYVQALPPALADVHRQRYVLCQSQREAGAALGLSRQQLRTREARLRDGLRRWLARG